MNNCTNINQLRGLITVTAIRKRGLGKRDKYIIYTEEYPDIPYISNPWLELTLKLYDIPKIKAKSKILIGHYKTTRPNNTCRHKRKKM